MAIGQKLEEARNRKGISLREASESTKIRGDYLSAFEASQFEINLPDVYLRGFVRLYARFLGLDQEAIQADLDLEMGHSSSKSSKKVLGSLSADSPDNGEFANSNTVSSKPVGESRLGETPDFFKPVLISAVALVVLVIALIVYWLTGSFAPQPQPDIAPPGTITETNRPPQEAINVVTDGKHSLTLAAIGPIQRLIVSDEGASNPSQRYREYKDLPAGWQESLTFSKSFRCYCSSLENLRFAVDDGAEKKGEGEGPGNFTWKME
jgi:cytoskeletal protein RodZ